MDGFCNRKSEFKEIHEHINDKVILIETTRSIGTTSFLEELSNQLDTIHNKTVYIPLTSTVKNIRTKIIDNFQLNKGVFKFTDTWTDMISCIKKGEIDDSIAAAALRDFPYIGESLSGVFKILKNSNSRKLQTEIDPSLYILKQISIDLKNTKFTILIDNIKFIDEQDLKELLSFIKEHENFYFIGTVYDDEYARKWTRLIKECLETTNSYHFFPFSKPDANMIKILAEHKNKQLTFEESQDIEEIAKGNIYKILDTLEDVHDRLSSMDNEVLKFIALLNFPLARTELIKLILKLYLDVTENDVDVSIQKLVNKNKLKKQNDVLYLNVSSYAEYTYLQRLNKTNNVIDYFKNKAKSLNIEQLRGMIRLGKDIYPDDLQVLKEFYHRLAILEIKEKNITITTNELDSAFSTKSFTNVRYRLIAFFMLNQLSQAYDYFLPIHEEYRNDIDMHLMWCILLNRTRREKEAEIELNAFIKKCDDIDYLCVASSYQMINYLYLNKPDEAIKVYDNSDFQASKFYGYFIRNSISVRSHDRSESISILKGMLEVDLHDDFLLSTIQCNLGRAYLANGDLEDAGELFDKAGALLECYQPVHKAILNNDIAIYYLLNNNIDSASSLIGIAKSQSSDFMQRCFIQLNESVILFLKDKEAGIAILNDLEKDIIAYHVVHLKEVYYSTRCLLEAFYKKDKLSYYIDKLKQFPDILRPDHTAKVISLYEHILQDEIALSEDLWNELYVPIYLVYWYVNPLNLIDF